MGGEEAYYRKVGSWGSYQDRPARRRARHPSSPRLGAWVGRHGRLPVVVSEDSREIAVRYSHVAD